MKKRAETSQSRKQSGASGALNDLTEKLAGIKPVEASIGAVESLSNVDTPAKIAYEQRVVAFVDILGFKEIIQRSKSDPEMVSQIFSALDIRKDSYAEAFAKEIGITENADFFADRFHSFSDCIVMSVSTRIEDIGLLIYSVFKICRSLLSLGFISRGGIAMGELYHRDDADAETKKQGSPSMIFGPAFIEAYQFESSHADGPRVILQNRVWTEICKYCDINEASKLAKFLRVHVPRAEDGPAFIDIFADFSINRFYETKRDLDNEISVIKDHICRALDASTDRPHVFKKNAFLAKEFNKAIQDSQRLAHQIPNDKLPQRTY